MIQYYCAATLDGFIADRDNGIDWLTGYSGSYEGAGSESPATGDGDSYERFYDEVGALVIGSTTYEWVLEHASGWPYPGKPCWVLSSRELEMPEGDDVDVRVRGGEVAKLADEMLASAERRNVWIVGGGPVASQFAEAGLLDELILTVVPVILGDGKPLFEQRLPGQLQLLGAQPRANGMVQLRYEYVSQ